MSAYTAIFCLIGATLSVGYGVAGILALARAKYDKAAAFLAAACLFEIIVSRWL
jgi:hypothetical protein